jgi:hypothetical protein
MENLNEFYDTIFSIMKDEINLTGTYQSKVFAFVESDGEFSVTTVNISNKNLDNVIDMLVKVAETKQVIDEFPKKILSDGKNPLAFAHTEMYYSEESRKIIFIKVKINEDGGSSVLEHRKYDIKNDEIFVAEDGSLKRQKMKLVEVED